MPTLPSAETTVVDTAGAVATGLETIVIWSPCAGNADMVPRQYGTADAVYQVHGYCEGVEYAALHAERTRKPFIFVGLPIDTLGAVGRKNTAGNTGLSVVDVAAGSGGILAEHDGVVTVEKGGTVGTDPIVLKVSCDGGRIFKRVRLGTAATYTIPLFNAVLSFTANTLVAGDTILTWHGTAPRSATSSWATARANHAAQMRGFRTALLTQDLASDTEATALLTQWNAYETANQRFTRGRASVYDRAPLATLSNTRAYMTGNPELTFLEVGATGDTITRASGSWTADGFASGDTITVTNTASNNVTGVATTVTASTITFDTTDLVNEATANAVVYATPTLTFAEVGGTGDTITRNRGSWIDDGFRNGDTIAVTGSVSNDVTGTVATVAAQVLTMGSTDLAAEKVSTATAAVVAGQTKAQWMAAVDAEFATIDAAPRIGLSAGRGRVLSPFSGWYMRRPAAWAASLREYQHDLHVMPWRKSDGPVGFDLYDDAGDLEEWDDRVDGSAGTTARFTTLRSWGNGPAGAFVAMDLTRATEGSLLSLSGNADVVNLACTTTQLNTENVVGRSLVLNTDGTATTDSLSTIESEVNAALELTLLQNRGEGPRCSKAVWTASKTDILNVVEAQLTGVLELNLNGVIHRVYTAVKVS